MVFWYTEWYRKHWRELIDPCDRAGVYQYSHIAITNDCAHRARERHRLKPIIDEVLSNMDAVTPPWFVTLAFGAAIEQGSARSSTKVVSSKKLAQAMIRACSAIVQDRIFADRLRDYAHMWLTSSALRQCKVRGVPTELITSAADVLAELETQEDRISVLPEPLLRDILRCSNNKDARMVSRHFHNVWVSNGLKVVYEYDLMAHFMKLQPYMRYVGP